MDHRIKTTTIVLGAIAAIAVWSFVEAATKQTNLSLSGTPEQTDQTSTGANPGDDPDHDGLINSDEVYWNTDPFNPDTDGDTFKDGEEVTSGHDPSIPGPDDLTADAKVKQNVTQKLSALLVSGLYEGSLKPDNTQYDISLDQLTTEAFEQTKFNLSTTPPSLSVVPANQQTLMVYAQGMSDIITNLTRTLQNTPSSGSESRNIFETHVAQIAQTRDTLVGMFVPETWKERHRDFIMTLDQLTKTYEALRQLETDPLQALAAYRIAQTIVGDHLPKLLVEYVQNLIVVEQ